jgi:O-antigen/teichoic acid export membrane protein
MFNAPANNISLRQRVFRAGLWSIGGYGLSQAIRMGSNLLLTRLLVPEMFGVMAIAWLIMTGLGLLSDLGLSQNITQSRRGNDPEFLDTVWVVQIFRSILLWLIALSIAVLILIADRFNFTGKDTVYADPHLPYVIAAVSFTAVIVGFRSTKFYEANRHLTLGQITLMGLVAQIVGLMCMLAWVSVDRSIWALVAGSICSGLTELIVSHVFLSGHSNRWHWDKSAFAEVLHFGKWLFLSSILGFFASSGDRLLLGGMVNATTLGVYVIAFLLFSSVEQVLARIIQSVAFPALSEIARKGTSMKAGYYRIHAVIAAVAYFSGGFLIISGQALVDILYDKRYVQAGWMLEILAVALLAVPSRIGVQCYLALGESSMTSIVAAIRLLLLLLLLPIGFYTFGLPGAVWGITLSYLSYLPSVAGIARRYALFDLKREVLLLPVILVGIAVGKLFVSFAPTVFELARHYHP